MREFDLLAHVYRQNAALPPRVVLPPGDDMGALRFGDQSVLVTVDQVADGVHVDLRTQSLQRVGRKAITRNLSDVAAMAALPAGAVVAAALPRDFGQQWALDLFDAMRRTAAEFRCPLFGGDITFWDHPLLLTVTVLAEPAGVEPVTRAGARVGDVVCVTGRLGGSLQEIAGYCHHLDFMPRIDLARKLASLCPLHAMIDLSDGLGRDLGHICQMSGVGAQVEAAKLPLSAGCQRAAAADGQPPWRHAVADGEDYELCFAVSPDDAQRLPEEIDGVPITAIGRIQGAAAGSSLTLIDPHGRAWPGDELGWEHQGP